MKKDLDSSTVTVELGALQAAIVVTNHGHSDREPAPWLTQNLSMLSIIDPDLTVISVMWFSMRSN